MTKLNTYWFAVLKLFIAGVIWGASFTLVRWSLVDFTTSQIMIWRFAIAFISAEVLIILFKKDFYKKTISDFKLSIFPGIFLGITILLQNHGLNYTTATNSAFITTIYVVMIPFMGYFLYKFKILISDVILAITALLGMVLLLHVFGGNSIGLKQFNFGDLLTFFCAMTSAVHIILIGVYAKKCKSPFRFNTFQTFWALITTLPFFFYESYHQNINLWPDKTSWQSVNSVIGLAVFVSLIAFYLQVTAQKILPTTTASMLCLLEAPFSYIFASLLLSEKLSFIQAIGALIILASATTSVYLEKRREHI